MVVRSLTLKQFRSFTSFQVAINAPVVFIQGPNGSGKTSLLEALYYACYLRSFRAASPRELISLSHDHFFIRLFLENASIQGQHELQVGFSPHKRLVKIDQTPITSYKEIFAVYRAISIIEDDLVLVQGGPEERRFFIDHVLILLKPEVALLLSKYRSILAHRNALLKRGHIDTTLYNVWTEQLFALSKALTIERQWILQRLEQHIYTLFTTYIDQQYTAELHPITFIYTAPRYTVELTGEYSDFLKKYPKLLDDERCAGRTLFGAHLDDIVVYFKGRLARTFASRGQQKLLVVLLKIAQVLELQYCQQTAIILLDDFTADLDDQRIALLLPLLLDLKTQLFFTIPSTRNILEDYLPAHVMRQTVSL